MSIPFEVKRTIQVSRQRVFESLLDLDAADHWMQGLVRMERLDDGPMKEGSEWKETRKMFGKEATEHFEVVELKEPEKIVLRCDGTKGTTGKGEFVFTYRIISTEESSEITLFGEIRGLTGLTKLFGKMMAGSFRKACARDLDALIAYLKKD
ncbi:polyketide cyclase / dehydrase and lipid transport [Virgibacillus sp. MSP4-1]|uniref:SRPBCC family protein n=1 Tax=Virgibacillus sp. MSP4-1 TaxID=2700081 RepID=UPI0003A9DDF6|nr:SRPBCC family protein [Virgibacillus sp. MSP4-1]QHS24366.1 polyketide cyclase / dehydrase and lipid transport [Virgibacillus sp. MSP4-1]